uniref:Uncharacterized protein n=1 Tax=Hyaloperonospora arabidopsidis (strain Emoy2) TaxID=559515 RepID=M4BR40_HYAAE
MMLIALTSLSCDGSSCRESSLYWVWLECDASSACWGRTSASDFTWKTLRRGLSLTSPMQFTPTAFLLPWVSHLQRRNKRR